MLRRLLDGFQQGVEGLGGQHGSALFEAEIPMALAVKSSVRKCVPVCYSARTQPVGRSYAALYEELKERLDKLEEN